MKFRIIIGLLLIVTSVKAQFTIGNFGSKNDFLVGINPQGLAVGDLNNDGKKDIISANNGSNFISLLINSNSGVGITSGRFSSTISLTTINANPTTVAVADFNGDGKNDIAVGYSSGIISSISIFMNSFTSGTISSSHFTRTDILVGITPAGLALGDIDGDNKIDLVCANFGSGTFSVLRNVSSTSSPVFIQTLHNTASGPNSTAIGDLDKDGKLDIAVTNWNSNSISIYKNNSSPNNISLSLVGTTSSISTQTNPYWISIVDFDNDSINDILCSNYSSNSFSIFKGTQVNSISFQARIDFSQNPNQFTQAAFGTDLNYDGKPDIGVVNAGNGSFNLLKNNYTSGAFTSTFLSSQFGLIAGSSPVFSMATDLDGDIRPDLIASNFGSNNISIFRNLIVSPQPTINASNISYSKSSGFVNINFTNGNGRKRLVILRENSPVNSLPLDENWYNSNDTFGLGTQLGTGNYLVYADTGNSVEVKGLNPLSTYYVSVIEYNGDFGFSNYLTSNILTGSFQSAITYYNKSNGPLDSLGTWGENFDGTGGSPASFYQDNTTYIAKNNSIPIIQNNWLIAGTSTSVIFGNDTINFNLTIPSNLVIAVDSFVVKSNITLSVLGNIFSNKAYFKDFSSVQFTSTQSQNIPGYDYFNLVSAFSNKTLSGNVKVRGTLSLISNINTSNYTLTLGNSGNQTGTLVRTNAYIIGNFSRWYNTSISSGNSGLFPIGTSTHYRPVQLDFTTAPSSSGQISAQFIEGNPGNSGLPFFDFSNVPIVNINKASINGVWRITNSGISGGLFSLACTGTGFFGINNLAEIRLIRRVIGGSWTSNGSAGVNTGSNASPNVLRTGMNQFGEFTYGGDISTNPLPVKLAEFTGKYINGSNHIKWSTSAEINNKEFKLFRKSAASDEWKSVYKVAGKISSNINLNYTFQDQDIDAGNSYYYQLIQVDLDGKETKSDIIHIENNISENYELNIYPNPANEILNIYSETDQKIQIFNQYDLKFEQEVKANNTFQIQVKDFSSGFYILKNCNSSGCFTQSIIIQH
jgi:hypothetical protein